MRLATMWRLAAMVAACACTLVFGPLEAAAQSDVIKLGILNDQSGPYADITGMGSVVAAQMAVEDFGGTVLGRKVTVIAADH